MKYQAFMRAAAVVLSMSAAALPAAAQSTSPVQTHPPKAVISDAAPPPAWDRSSMGAVILMEEPVLAQRAQMEQMLARSEPDTRSMGAAGRMFLDLFRDPAPVRQGAPLIEEQRAQ